MENFEQKIANTVNEKLNDGTVEKLIDQYIEKSVAKSLDDIFGYGGKGKKLIQSKLEEVMIPVIEKHDFNQYLVKLDSVLTEIINNTTLKDNAVILDNFKELLTEPKREEINLSEIFKEYCKFVASYVDTDNLEAICEDREPYYEHVCATMEVEHEDKGWFKSNYDDCIVKFTCEEDESLNLQINLYKKVDEAKWHFRFGQDVLDVNSLRYMNRFMVFISVLNRAYTKINMAIEHECDDDIEPDEKPEWELN